MKRYICFILAISLMASVFPIDSANAKQELDTYEKVVAVDYGSDDKEALVRLYNNRTGEHFYTGSEQEWKNFILSGWIYEGMAWSYPKKSDEPVFRLKNNSNGEYHYTSSIKERDFLKNNGWTYEGVAWYSGGELPVYRLYCPAWKGLGSHHFTMNTDERDNLLKNGWKDEGVSFYAAGKLISAQGPNRITPINELQNYKSIKKNCSDAELQAAYNEALKISLECIGMSEIGAINHIFYASIREMVDSGRVQYTDTQPHYNDPYGYFVLGIGSCAGATRATGLCLNILGFSYEHVNENQWTHQWCRVKMKDGSYAICDSFGLYVGPEEVPYQHPKR